jgi:hypothetical protein
MDKRPLINNSANVCLPMLATFVLLCAFINAAWAGNIEVIDVDDKTIVPPDFNSIDFLMAGKVFAVTNAAAANEADKKYYVSLDGKRVEAAGETKESAQDPELPEGCSVCQKEDQYLFVNGTRGPGVFSLTGREIIAPSQQQQVEYLGDGMFGVAHFGDAGAVSRFLVDSKGLTVCKLPDWARIAPGKRFHEGLLNIGEAYVHNVFINKRGASAFKCDYSDVSDFSGGLAVVRYTDRLGATVSGCINCRGDMVIGPLQDTQLSPFSNGLATISKTVNGKTTSGVIDKSGKFVVPCGFDTVSPNIDGTFLATKDKHFVLLNPKGEVQIRFPESVTTVQLPDTISKQTLIPCGFGGSGDRAKYLGKLGAKWGYCDWSGKVIISPKFSYCSAFIGDLAVACAISHDDEQLDGVIDKEGNWIIQPKYQWVQIVSPNRFLVCLPDKSPSDAWKSGQKRFDAFADLLERYNFIRMKKTELQHILGEPGTSENAEGKHTDWVSLARFDFSPYASCGFGSARVEFGIDKNDQVFGWRIEGGSRMNAACPWITENVTVEDRTKELTLANLAPKEL